MECPSCKNKMKAISSITGYYFADNVIISVVFEVVSWVFILSLSYFGMKGYITIAIILIVVAWLHWGKRWYKCAHCGHSEVNVKLPKQ